MDIEDLYSLAQERLSEKRYAEARELGHRLLKFRFSGAFEILAKAFYGTGEIQVAVKVLESGLEEAPTVWLLWLQLGNYRSELGDLNAAVEAYAKARSCPGAEGDQIDFNEAFMRSKFGNKVTALDLFRKVYLETKDKKLKVVALTHRLTTLIELDQVTEALMELGEAYLHEADNAELLSKLAFQLLHKGDEKNALNLAKQALGLRRAGEVARVLRLLEGEVSEASRLYEVKLRGQLEGENGMLYFHKISRVFADEDEEAMKIALNFEPPDLREELFVESVELIAPQPNEQKGVDWSSALLFYDPAEK